MLQPSALEPDRTELIGATAVGSRHAADNIYWSRSADRRGARSEQNDAASGLDGLARLGVSVQGAPPHRAQDARAGNDRGQPT